MNDIIIKVFINELNEDSEVLCLGNTFYSKSKLLHSADVENFFTRFHWKYNTMTIEYLNSGGFIYLNIIPPWYVIIPVIEGLLLIKIADKLYNQKFTSHENILLITDNYIRMKISKSLKQSYSKNIDINNNDIYICDYFDYLTQSNKKETLIYQLSNLQDYRELVERGIL